jgi:hypothetical protein
MVGSRIKGLIDEITSVRVPELPEFDDLAVVTGSTGVAQNHYVRENFHRCLDLFSKMWHHHTEFLMLGYGAYVVFFQFCKQAFPGDHPKRPGGGPHGGRHRRDHVPARVRGVDALLAILDAQS